MTASDTFSAQLADLVGAAVRDETAGLRAERDRLHERNSRLRASHDRLLAVAEHAYRILMAIHLRRVWDGSEIPCLAFLDAAIADAEEPPK
jgi:hypothetical protein